jgi:hypothetical protein
MVTSERKWQYVAAATATTTMTTTITTNFRICRRSDRVLQPFEIVRMHHVRGARDGAACKISDTTASFSTGDKLQVPWVQLLTQESEFQ